MSPKELRERRGITFQFSPVTKRQAGPLLLDCKALGGRGGRGKMGGGRRKEEEGGEEWKEDGGESGRKMGALSRVVAAGL